MLINQEVWKNANDNHNTICQMFLDKLNGTSLFNINNSIIRNVSNVGGGIQGLDLLPSSINLLDLQERIPMINSMNSFAQSPITVLASELTQDIVNRYDYILIDCPPNLGAITLNGIFISDYFLIPVVPDILSTYGIPQILDKIGKVYTDVKAINRTYDIKPMGIIVTKFRVQSRMHKETKDDLVRRGLLPRVSESDLIQRSRLSENSKDALPKVFEEVIKETNKISESTDVDAQISTLKQKYGYATDIYDSYYKITEEFLQRTK